MAVCVWLGECARASVILCLVGMVQTTILSQSLLNFTCKLLIMRGGILLILCLGVKGQGQIWHLICLILSSCGHYKYRLLFLLSHVQTSHVSCL